MRIFRAFASFLVVSVLPFAFCLSATPLPDQAAPNSSMEMPSVAPPSYESAFIKMILALLGLIVLFVLSIWILRKIGRLRFGGRHSTHSIQILERCALSPKTVLFLVEVENEKVLIAESQLEVRRLASLKDLSQETAEN